MRLQLQVLEKTCVWLNVFTKENVVVNTKLVGIHVVGTTPNLDVVPTTVVRKTKSKGNFVISILEANHILTHQH